MSKTKTTTNSFINPIKLFKIMSKKLLTFLTLLTLFFGVGWAETATVTLTQSNLELTGSYTTNTQKTIDGITYVYTDLMKNNENIQAKASSGEIHNSTAFSGDITSVVITHSGTARATTISGSSDGTNWTQVATGSGSITGNFSGKGYKYFKITRGSNAAYWTKIEITYEASGGGGDDPTPTTGTQYERVTQSSQLTEDGEYVIITVNDAAAVGAYSNKIRTAVTSGFSISGNIVTVSNTDISVFTLTQGAAPNDDYWYLNDGTNWLGMSSGADISTNKTLLNISPTADYTTIANPNASDRCLLYNGTQFKNYATSNIGNTYKQVYLYKKVESTVEKTYDVAVTQVTGGTINADPEGEKVIDAGEKITVTATPEPGYELSSWIITGASESEPDANNQITATGDVTITATFSKIQYSITNVVKTNGEVSGAGGGLNNFTGVSTVGGVWGAQVGDEVTFTANTYQGYQMLQSGISIKDAENNDVSFTFNPNNGNLVTFTMPASNVTVTANFTSYRGTIRLAGRFNGNTGWRTGTSGPAFTYDSTNDKYTIDAYFTGEGEGNYFFITYDGNASYPSANGNWGVTNTTGTPVGLTWDGNGHNFAIENGVFTIELAGDLSTIAFTKKEPTLTFSPVAGEVEQGATVSATSNLTTMIAAIKAIDSNAGGEVTVGVNTDNGDTWNASETLNTVGSATVYGKAYIGNISATGTASYNVVTHYAVTATANPTVGGTVSVSPASALAGETVTITANPRSGYQLTSITVNGDEIDITSAPYTFTMPAQATEVIANFSKIQYAITKAETHCTVNITGDENVTITTDGATAGSGDVVTFTVTPITDKYSIKSVSLVWDNGAATTTPTLTNGVYSFNMQARPVVITAVCEREAVGDGSFVLVTDASTLKAGDKVIITNSKTAGTFKAMGASRGNNRAAIDVTITEDLKITPSAILPTEGGVQVLTLEGDENGWYFNTGGEYLYAGGTTSNNNNYLSTGSLTTANGRAEATISIGESAVITFSGANRNVIRYNSGNNPTIFSCYAATGQNPVYLFKQTAAGLMVEIDPDGGQVIGSQEVTIDANVEGAMVQYKIGDDGEWSTPATGPVTATITGNVGDNVKVYAKATLEDDGETLTDETDATFTFVTPNAPVITPASCSITSETQNVTITSDYADGIIEYSTDGGTTWNVYSNAFNVVVEGVGESVTVQARVTYNGVTSETATATYTRNVQPVVFSPASGTYYGDQTCQMFSTTKGARIYYTTDGSEPVMNQGTTQLYTGEIEMTAGNTYNFKAVAYIGTTASVVTPANYTIKQESEYVSSSEYDNNKLYSVAELNAVNVPLTDPYYTTDYYEMVNPVQVIYMSTYKQNGYQPEFCLVRDNTGYGMIYFGKQNSAHNNFKVFEMGDWIGGGYSGQVSNFYDPNQQVLSDTHPELGRSGSGQHIYNWVTSAMSNSTVLPEYLTISEIQLSDPTGSNADYWGHYVHLRKNTIELVQSDDPGNYTTGQDKDGKWSGTITDENGQSIMYYDKFYLQIDKDWTTTNNDFTGHPNRTFDVYGFVACYKNVYQISPFDFAWIDQPVCDHETGTYTTEQTVALSSPDDPTATIWYKTSEMDDYAVYTEPFTVNSTTTIEWYATKQSQYNDELESKKGTITMTFTTINPPVIAPESQVKAVGSESVNSTITRDNSDGLTATIWFTIDGSDPSDPSSDRYEYNTTNQATMLSDIRTTTTVRAIAEVDGIYSAEAEARTYTFVKSNGIVYDLVTSVSQLNENGVYVIVSQNYSEALSTTQNTTNRGAAGVLFVEDTNKTKVYGNDDVAQFTLTVLTHDEDTSPERHFLMQTNNSSQNGYLYVGSESNNTLLTEANEDAMGNDVAVITIDADGRAHIHFNYAGGDNRYLQYWNRDRLFNTYKSEYDDRAVYIYGVNATPLATIEKEGTALPTTTTAENQYTIADQLIAVYYKDAQNDAGEHYLWCKDQGNVSISKTEKTGDDQIDYLKDVTKVQNGDWDQSNWVVLKFTNPTNVETISGAVGKYINPASITGHYTDGVNFTITLPEGADLAGKVGDKADFTPNVYCPVNYLDANLNLNGGEGPVGVETGEHYFFMNPKIQEVATVTYAVWNGTCFVIPAKAGGNNQGDFDGAFSVAWTYNAYGDQKDNLQANTAYQFKAVLNTGDAKLNSYANTGAKAGENAAGTVIGKEVDPQAGKVVYALDLNGGTGSDNIITAIQDVADGTGKAVAGVKYYNLAGIESDRPFEGVNIVVTTYTDGSRSSSKVLK